MYSTIHNFYSDFLLSIKTLFDNVIFKNNLIKHYSFNLANRTFELSKRDYKPNRQLPSIVIILNNDEYIFGERPTNIIHSTLDNINQIPILYSPKNNIFVFIQEEQTNISVSLTINCDSQFQAKEIEFIIKRFLPLNKYTNIHSFTSFIEIDKEFLLTTGLDFNDHEIINLFTKLNKNIGRSEYCYSLNYQPLIKLDSIDSNIISTVQTSFSVSVNLSMIIQFPLYIIYEHIQKEILKINVDFTRFGNEPITYHSMRSFTKINEELRLTDPYKQTQRNMLIHDLNEHNLTTVTTNNITYKLFEIKFEPDDFIIQDDFLFKIFDIYNNPHDITPTLIDTDINTVKFQIIENDFNNLFDATLTTPIIVQFLKVL